MLARVGPHRSSSNHPPRRRGPAQRSVCHSCRESSAPRRLLRMSQPTLLLIAHPVRKRLPQLRARGDLQLRKDSVEMTADGSGGQEEAFGDLTLRQTVGGELSDLELLRGQAIAEIGRAPPNLLSGSAQLLSRSPTPRGVAQRIEELHAFPQWRPRFGAPPSPSQPAAKRKQCPGSKKRIARERPG